MRRSICQSFISKLFRTAIPLKIFENMAVGTPILIDVKDESAQLVIRAGYGVCIPPGNVDVIAKTSLELAEHPELLTAMRRHSRRVVRHQYSRRTVSRRYLESLLTAISNYHGLVTVSEPQRAQQQAA